MFLPRTYCTVNGTQRVLLNQNVNKNVPYSIHYSHLGQAMNQFINAVGQIHPLISILETSLLGSSENDAGPGSGTATPAQWDVRTSTLLEIRRFSFIIEALWKTSYNTRRVASHASAVGILAGWLGHEASSKSKHTKALPTTCWVTVYSRLGLCTSFQA